MPGDMQKNHRDLPVFMHDDKTREILNEAISCIPAGTQAYIVGGAARNSVYYKFFKKKLPSRDYDLLLIGDKNLFIKNLKKYGFSYGHTRKKHEITMKKKLISHPKELKDYVYLDIHLSSEKSILKNLKQQSSFTINGFALSLRDINSQEWYDKIIALPAALHDIKNKQLRVNVIAHPGNLFACLRFMSLGFKPPSSKEISMLHHSLRKLEKYRFDKNVQKAYRYVGGERRARKLAKDIGITEDIFDFETVRSTK